MKKTKLSAEPAEPEDEKVLVSRLALQEIRCVIYPSLESAIDFWLEAQDEQLSNAAVLIRPAVERLARIAEENKFPE